MERILFLGLGYIGLPTAALAASRGLEVVGVDVDPAIVGKVNRGEIHIVEPGLAEAVREAVSAGRLRASLEPVPGDVYVVVVPTPFKGNHEPDVSYVEAGHALGSFRCSRRTICSSSNRLRRWGRPTGWRG